MGVYDVIVVGCGAAGVAAIRRLHDAGLSVLGLEAADRIGGRINTVQFADNVIDLGAQWCECEEGNVTYELASEHNVFGRPEPDTHLFLQSDGKLMASEVSEQLMDYCKNLLDTSDKGLKQSIPGYLDSEFDPKIGVSEKKWAIAFLEWYKKFLESENSADPNKAKSLHGLAESWSCSGQMLTWKDNGTKTILDVLLKKYPNAAEEISAEILQGKEVINITLESEPGSDSTVVEIKCKDGSTYKGTHVIITVSVGVLKERHGELFTPALSDSKVNTINNLEMAVLDKIYLQFTKPWWPATPTYIGLLWRAEDIEKISPDNRWVTDIYGMSNVDCQPNILCAWLNDTGARNMERLSLDRIQKGLDELFKSYFSKEFEVSKISQILRSQWASNRFTRGSYSYRSLNTELKGGGSIELSEPVCSADGTPIICFAGEATSHHHFGAVHGAIESGFREADRIIKLKNNN